MARLGCNKLLYCKISVDLHESIPKCHVLIDASFLHHCKHCGNARNAFPLATNLAPHGTEILKKSLYRDDRFPYPWRLKLSLPRILVDFWSQKKIFEAPEFYPSRSGSCKPRNIASGCDISKRLNQNSRFDLAVLRFLPGKFQVLFFW